MISDHVVFLTSVAIRAEEIYVCGRMFTFSLFPLESKTRHTSELLPLTKRDRNLSVQNTTTMQPVGSRENDESLFSLLIDDKTGIHSGCCQVRVKSARVLGAGFVTFWGPMISSGPAAAHCEGRELTNANGIYVHMIRANTTEVPQSEGWQSASPPLFLVKRSSRKGGEGFLSLLPPWCKKMRCLH